MLCVPFFVFQAALCFWSLKKHGVVVLEDHIKETINGVPHIVGPYLPTISQAFYTMQCLKGGHKRLWLLSDILEV